MSTDGPQAGPSSRAPSVHKNTRLDRRIPLLTPSASPPVQRSYARPDVPTSTKKRRMSQTPSLLPSMRSNSDSSVSAPSATPSFSRSSAPPDPDAELDSARRANSLKVLNVWASLAEKYERQLDEDDIIDLENETVIKDCGVLRATTDIYGIGCFAEQQERQRQDDEAGLDDDMDEIDAFADNADYASQAETDAEEELELLQSQRLPPVRELDPKDAADLAEFLEAENARRARLGDPDDDDDVDDLRAVENNDEAGGISEDEQPDNHSGSEFDKFDEQEEPEDSELDAIVDYRTASTPSGSPELDVGVSSYRTEDKSEEELQTSDHSDDDASVHLDSDNEAHWVNEGPASSEADSDELNTWDQDEGNVVYSLDDDVGSVHSSESIEQEVTTDAGREPSLYASTSTQQILATETRGRSRKLKLAGKAEAKVASSVAARAVPSSSVIQLQTPPRSSSVASSSEPKETFRLVSNLERKTPKKYGSLEKLRRTKRVVSPELLVPERKASTSGTPPRRRGGKGRQPESSTSMRSSRLIPEVVIDVHPRSLSKAFRFSSPAPADDGVELQSDVTVLSNKGKGKSRALNKPSDDDFDRTQAKPSRRSSPAAPASPNPLPKKAKAALNPKKRRRVSSPIPDFTDEKQVNTDRECSAKPSRNQLPAKKHEQVPYKYDHIDEDEDEIGDTRPGPSAAPQIRSRSRSGKKDRSQDATRQRHSDVAYHRSSSHPHFPSRPTTNNVEENYDNTHQAPYLRSQSVASSPHLQDPTMQYHLAQALQSLSIIMGGTIPFGPPPSQIPYPETKSSSATPHRTNIHPPWPPYTPHHQRLANYETPQSAASAPPTSSPPGSDYSDEGSSPIKSSGYDRGRPHSISRQRASPRLRSAIRGSRSRSHSKIRLRRRVSFSSPEAVHIEDTVYEVVHNDSRQSSDYEESDTYDEGRQLRSMPHLRSEIRAQTPGPPSAEPPYEGRRAHYENIRPRLSSNKREQAKSRTRASGIAR